MNRSRYADMTFAVEIEEERLDSMFGVHRDDYMNLTRSRTPFFDLQRERILAQVGDAAETTIMTPINPRWCEFIRLLDFAIRVKGGDGESFGLAKRVMARIEGIDVQRSVGFFEEHGLHCADEVLEEAQSLLW